jgi:cell division protease FtsH
MALPERDKVLRSKEAIEEEIAGLLGGRIAEELQCGSVTTGAANDLERASALARAMVTQYGMSDELGLRTFAVGDQAAPGWPPQQREYAEGTALRIDAEINGILDRAYARAKAVLTERWGTISRLAGALLEHETLERPEIEKLLVNHGAGTEVPCAEEVTA